MGSNPINLIIRFTLEMGALFIFGLWGWKSTSAPLRTLLTVGLPVFAALAWGVFNVPGDPSRSGKAPVPVPGFVRLMLELLIFGAACWVLFDLGYKTLGWIGGIIVLIHYGVSYDRIMWLLRQ